VSDRILRLLRSVTKKNGRISQRLRICTWTIETTKTGQFASGPMSSHAGIDVALDVFQSAVAFLLARLPQRSSGQRYLSIWSPTQR
ncbi:MAG: hypothetical protein WBE71_04185, partial [Xanthobacteraceae bacterium]